MHHDYDFVIIGAGMVADAAARGIREQGAQGSIGILGEEPTAPFARPALSTKLWTEPETSVDSAALSTADDTGAVLHLGTRITSLDVQERYATAADGDTFGYGRLLVATGSRPRTLPGLEPSARVLYYRSLSDYRRLRALAGGGADIAVVGGGSIGSEIAAALSEEEVTVSLVFDDEVLGAASFPDGLAQRFHSLFEEAGVHLVGGVRVESGTQDGDRVTLQLSSGASHDYDAVVVGVGVEPCSDFAASVLDLADDGGIVVDERLRASAPDVWAAGDVAQYPDRILGRTRVEHVDNADAQGSAAGRIMAGSAETYDHTPMYYSDVLEHGYEAVGVLDSSLETVVDEGLDGADPDATVVYYLDDSRVRGVLIWDGEGGIDEARRLLATHTRPADPSDLVGAIR